MSRYELMVVVLMCGGSASGQGPEYRLQPVGVTDVANHTIIDNEGSPGVPSEVMLLGELGPNATIDFEIHLSGWGDAVGSPELNTYTVTVDGLNGYSSGAGADLVPLGGCCPGDPAGWFIDTGDPDWVHADIVSPCIAIPATAATTLNYQLGTSIIGSCSVPDDGTIKYGGTLVLSIPQGANGTYDIPFVNLPLKTFMSDLVGTPILPLTLTPVSVTVHVGRCCCYGLSCPPCVDGITEAECSALAGGPAYYFYFPGQACDTPGQPDCEGICNFHPYYCWDILPYEDYCRWGECNFETGYCEYWPLYDPATACCNSSTGTNTPIEEGRECLYDYCETYCHYSGGPCATDADCPWAFVYDWCIGTGQQAPMPFGTSCEHENLCAANAQCEFGECVGDLPEYTQIPCTEHGECPEPWYCNPDTGLCDCLDDWDEVRKNRYISFATEDVSSDLAYQVELTASANFPASVGVLGWIGGPFDASCVDEQGNPLSGNPACEGKLVSRVTAEPFFSSDWPAVVRVGDCQIVPVSTYQIRSTTDGMSFGDPVVLETVRQADKSWGDVIGGKIGGLWTPPNGVVNFDDIQATIQGFERVPGAPHWIATDLDGQKPNAVVNMTDIQRVILAFEGAPYPFSAPAACP